MHNPKIHAKLENYDTAALIGEAYLLVVPDVGEMIHIGQASYIVKRREFVLTQQYNGGKPYGFSQSVILFLS